MVNLNFMPLKLWLVRVDASVVADNHLHHGDSSIIKARQKAIYAEDAGKTIRKSHENPYIIKLYDEFLGKPLSEKSHHLLHTHYFDKSKPIRTVEEGLIS